MTKTTTQRGKAMYDEENKCKWCGSELPEVNDWIEFCPDTDCEYDYGKWRKHNQ